MIPTRIGQTDKGCYFAGFNRVRDKVYALWAAPASSEKSLIWTGGGRGYTFPGVGALSSCDGASNTAAFDEPFHLAAQYCMQYTHQGLNDFYLPSMNELEMLHRYYKPTRELNCPRARFFETGSHFRSENVINHTSIPTCRYTPTSPSQTLSLSHIPGSSETFGFQSYNWYWASTEYCDHSIKYISLVTQSFYDGYQDSLNKTNMCIVRPVRREVIV